MNDSASLKRRLADAFSWWSDGESSYADPSGWWQDGSLLRDTAAALGGLHEGVTPTVVAGVEATGFILGTAVAMTLGLGFVEVRKDERRPLRSWENVLRVTTPPDYVQRDLVLQVNRARVSPGDRVLLVDEWLRTGAQATAARDLVEMAGASFVGVSVIVADTSADVRRSLNIRSLIRKHELPSW